VALVMFAGEDGASHPGAGRIARTLRTSPGAVRRSVASLEQEAGPLTLKVERGRQTASGDQDSHRYVLTLKEGNPLSATPDQTGPTPDQGDPTPRSSVPNPVGSAVPHPPIRRTHKEDTEEDPSEGDKEDPRVREVFDHWSRVLWSRLHQKQPKASADRLKPIRARLKTFDVAQLKLAIDHVAADDWMIDNAHIEPITIFRNDAKAAHWVARKPRGPVVQRDLTPERADALLAGARARAAEMMRGGAE
jgi:hypothetical protein